MLRFDVILVGRLAIPLRGLGHVLLDALALVIERAQPELGVRVAALG